MQSSSSRAMLKPWSQRAAAALAMGAARLMASVRRSHQPKDKGLSPLKTPWCAPSFKVAFGRKLGVHQCAALSLRAPWAAMPFLTPRRSPGSSSKRGRRWAERRDLYRVPHDKLVTDVFAMSTESIALLRRFYADDLACIHRLCELGWLPSDYYEEVTTRELYAV